MLKSHTWESRPLQFGYNTSKKEGLTLLGWGLTKGSHNPILRGLTITMVINHLINGMILQVRVQTHSGSNRIFRVQPCIPRVWTFGGNPFNLRTYKRILRVVSKSWSLAWIFCFCWSYHWIYHTKSQKKHHFGGTYMGVSLNGGTPQTPQNDHVC